VRRCAALYLPRPNFSECVRSSGLTLPNAYFLTPPERDIAVILPCATMRYHRDVAERRSDDVALLHWRACASARTPFTSRLLRRSAEVYLPHADLSSCVRSAEINPAQAAPRAARQRIPSRCVRCRVQGRPPYLARANKACQVCLRSKLDRDGAMRGRPRHPGSRADSFPLLRACAEQRISPQPRRKSCNGLSLYGFCEDSTAYAVRAIHAFNWKSWC